MRRPLWLLVPALAALAASCGSSGGDSIADQKSSAYYACMAWVKEDLKAPSTADFPDYDSGFVTTDGAGSFSVTAYVDAENSSGAKLRQPISCETSHIGDGWRPDSVSP